MPDGSPAVQLTDVDPRRLGKWEVQERIGVGGMGVVYRARCGEQDAAVKVVRHGLLDDPQVAARFEREAEVLRSVHDRHISRFLDADINAMPAWLATEYVPGSNLRDAVGIWGPLSVARWWDLARGLAQALSVLEIHGIMHRDIKPANVIMSRRGPVLIDFGIAHPEDATSLTATGIVTGSPSWLSPEQVALGDLTAASDVFSLGSLLAFAATGRPPFGQGATMAVLMNIQRSQADLDGIDPTRRVLLERMLAKDPAARPTAREVLEVARGMRDLPEDATTAIPAPRTPQPSAGHGGRGRRPKVLPVVLAGLLALGVGYAGYSVLDGPPGRPDSSRSAAPAEAPPFPGSNQLSAGDWLLSRYAITQDGGRLVIEGTVVNNGPATAATDLTVHYYIDGAPVAVATGNTGEVAAGASASVRLTSEDPWQPGDPVLVVSAR